MALNDLIRAILALFGHAPAAAPAPSVSPSSTPAAAQKPAIAAPAAAIVPVVPVHVTPSESVGKPEVAVPAMQASSPQSLTDQGERAAMVADDEAWLSLARPLSQHFENCYLTAYPDPASPLGKALQARGLWYRVLGGEPIPNDPVLRALSGAPWTCGWGSTGPDVKQGTRWTQELADLRHDENLRTSAVLVEAAARVPLSAQQKAAMVCIVNNVGAGRAARAGEPGRDGIITLASGQPSTLLRHLNIGDYAGAADQFPAWNKAGGVVVPGLVRRRAAERDLFLNGKWSTS
ncbi:MULTISPECIES: lysozyme [Burkholderia]|uniref:Lysozyme n=1 Tax=Burkholderia contaminans TaxID=488447 RepID=A0A2S5DRK9_9BURK|nr:MULTISPECIES: lysozyme [Burkholderia]EKS9798224.1 lysozyme [Burkholderia cepacia]EKS9808371.1 lysozyme [Burkholderia cepacia]EKS9815981.1 lysozyme [Burkholderia cepacia]EKS9823575.1 lysozyme [Burkholderia cepacia]EKS9827303.1 lysozyme [Burkholderia cepacia]